MCAHSCVCMSVCMYVCISCLHALNPNTQGQGMKWRSLICLSRGSTLHHSIQYQGNTHCRILPMRNQLRKEEFNHDPVSDVHNIILHGMNSRSTCVHYNCSVHALYYMHNNVFILMTWEMRREKEIAWKKESKEWKKRGKRKAQF